MLGESYSGSPLNGVAITNTYDTYLRRSTLSTLGTSPTLTTTYGYDNASRLLTVNDGSSHVATYSYLANSPLVGQIVYSTGGSTRMTTTKQYDDLNRLTQISSAPSGTGILPVAYNYAYNTANQRTRNTFGDGSHWVYQYDWLGQVTNGARYWNDGTPVAGQQYQYAFDTIGNRRQACTGGDTNGANLRVANYTVNNLNQYTQRGVPGTNDIVGVALQGTNVTVNGVATDRKLEYFHGPAGTNNASHPAWLNVAVAGGGNNVTGHLYVAQSPEQFQYDLDGNLTNDGRWAYTWDAENRLIGMTVNTNVGPQYQLSFVYDSQGRRIQKIVTTNGVTFTTNNFVYDDWNLIAETLPNNSLIRNYVWGNDLSGSPQGAGGVGGLLQLSYHGASTTNGFIAYDGNGNAADLVNAADGTVLASYEYGPFGEAIRSTGPLAKNNPLRFSTKYQDDESDLIYYGLRFYRSSTGAWLSRDPIVENGGIPLYVMVGNHPLQGLDRFGLIPVDDSPIPTDIQTSDQGVGPLVERMYVVGIFDSTKTGKEIVENAKTDINYFVGTPFLRYFGFASGLSPNYLAVGNIYQIAGPGVNPYVKVVNADDLSWTFVTMKGHPEAGTITFRANDTSCGEINFTIHSMTRAATLSDWFLYTFPIPIVGPPWDTILHGDLDPRGTGYRGLGYAVQTSIWTHFLHRVVDYSGGTQIGDIWYMDRWNFSDNDP